MTWYSREDAAERVGVEPSWWSLEAAADPCLRHQHLEAHVGLHAGPVLFQEGDYFGQTVNLSSRIADYARQGEVLVSPGVADASSDPGTRFADIGPVELQGISGTVHLLRAHLA